MEMESSPLLKCQWNLTYLASTAIWADSSTSDTNKASTQTDLSTFYCSKVTTQTEEITRYSVLHAASYCITRNFRKGKFTKIQCFRVFQKNIFENHTQIQFFWKLHIRISRSPVGYMFPRAASMVAEMDTFQLDSVVCGHHVYKNIWSSMLGKELKCICETGNVHDLYAVSVVKTGTGTYCWTSS